MKAKSALTCTRGSAGQLVLDGELDLTSVSGLMDEVEARGADIDVLDLSALRSIDTAGVAALAVLRDRAQRRGAELTLAGLNDDVRSMLLHLPEPPRSKPPDPTTGFFEWIGALAYDAIDTTLDATRFTGRVFASVFARGGVPLRETARQTVRIGVDGFPIVGMISYLVGLIIAFQSAWQLQRFGATSLVAPMVSFMMVRELGPLMMGILLAGRSGSAVAAELGTMVVKEEEAALKTMGLDPVRFLALPRFLGFLVAGPLLAVMAMVLGVVGGLTIGMVVLDLDPLTYYHQTVRLLRVGSFFNGMSKAVIYSALVGLIACYTGLAIKGGAMAVGRATTRTVVVSIFSIIVADFVVTLVTIGSLT